MSDRIDKTKPLFVEAVLMRYSNTLHVRSEALTDRHEKLSCLRRKSSEFFGSAKRRLNPNHSEILAIMCKHNNKLVILRSSGYFQIRKDYSDKMQANQENQSKVWAVRALRAQSRKRGRRPYSVTAYTPQGAKTTHTPPTKRVIGCGYLCEKRAKKMRQNQGAIILTDCSQYSTLHKKSARKTSKRRLKADEFVHFV